MASTLPPLTGQASRRQSLLAAVLGMPERRFAVMDGAHIDNLQRDLLAAGLDFRPLYLDEKDAPALASGPHLVELRNGFQVERVLDIAGEKPAVVFWSWPDTGAGATSDAIFRHLRSINLVDVPRGTGDPSAQDKARAHAAPLPAVETVLFRHADANVLSQVLPALEAPQYARFIGRSPAVIFAPEPDYADRAGWHEAGWFEGLPKPPNGRLSLSRAALDIIEERRARAIRRSIARHLRETARQDMREVDEEEIVATIARSEATARELGIKTAEHRKKWAWLDLVSDGNFGRSATVREHLTRPRANHGWDMDMFVQLARRELRRHE